MWARRVWARTELGARGTAEQEGAGQSVWLRAGARVTKSRAGRSAHASRRLGPVARVDAWTAWPGGTWTGRGRSEERGSGGGACKGQSRPFPSVLRSPSNRGLFLGSGTVSGCSPLPMLVLLARSSSGSIKTSIHRSCADSAIAVLEESCFILFIAYFFSLHLSWRQDLSWV